MNAITALTKSQIQAMPMSQVIKIIPFKEDRETTQIIFDSIPWEDLKKYYKHRDNHGDFDIDKWFDENVGN